VFKGKSFESQGCSMAFNTKNDDVEELDDAQDTGEAVLIDDEYDDDEQDQYSLDDASYEEDEDDDGSFVDHGVTPFDDAADSVETWARSVGVASDPFIRDFVSGLRNRSDLTFWGTVDLEEEFPEPALDGRLRGFAKWLIRLRNIAVFAPVGLTWWAISRVSPGFTDYVDERLAQGEDANFLQYWSQVEIDSFLPRDFFQIQDIALLGSLIIAGIIVATIVALIIDRALDRRSEDAMRRRSQVILAARRSLHSAREATPQSLATSLAESMTELVESSRMIIDAARRLEQASVGVSQLEPTFRSLNDQLEVFDSRLGDTIVGSVDRLNASVAGLTGLMDGNLKGLLSESVAGIDEVREQLHRTAASVEFGTQQFLKDLAAVQGRPSRPAGPSVSRPNGQV